MLRAIGWGLVAAAALAAVHAQVVEQTEHEFGLVSVILGVVVGLVVRLSRPTLNSVWIRIIAIALALFSLLLTEYLLLHYGDFESSVEDPTEFLFWGLSLVAAGRAAAAQGSGSEEAEWSRETKTVQDDPTLETGALDLNQAFQAGPDRSLGAPFEDRRDSTVPAQDRRSEPVQDSWDAVERPKSSASTRPPKLDSVDGLVRRAPEMRVGWAIAGMTITALAVGAVGLGVLVEWGAGSAPSRAQDEAGQPVGGGADVAGEALVEYADLRVGDCVRDMQSEAADLGLAVVDCESDLHTDEVFWTFALPRQKWPGEKRIDRLGWRGCDARLRWYVGVGPDATSLDEYMAPPVKMSWPKDRVVVCTISDGPGSHRGSLKNADR